MIEMIKRVFGILYAHFPVGEVECLAAAKDVVEAIREPTELTDWQPIETAPKDGRDILISDPKYRCLIAQWHPVKSKKAQKYPGYWRDGLGCNWYEPTYWMPLIDAPDVTNAPSKP